MNARIDPAIIAEAYEADPEAARAEYGAEFRDDLADFVSPEAVHAVTIAGRHELPPAPGVIYSAFVDPSGGSSDAMALAVGMADAVLALEMVDLAAQVAVEAFLDIDRVVRVQHLVAPLRERDRVDLLLRTGVAGVGPAQAGCAQIEIPVIVARAFAVFAGCESADVIFVPVCCHYGVKFPTAIMQKQGGYPTLDLSVTDVKPNAPASIQGNPAGAPQTPPATSQKLADGVYLILPAYAALAVDFKDYIVVVEGPQSEERANAIITEAKRVIPNKPIKYVVNTHNHFDHAGGLRTFVAEGATIVTYQGNKGYYEKIFALPHTLNPDRQATTKKKISIETMTDKKVLTDGNHVIELHRLQGSNHNDGLIVAYLPKEKILVEADAFNPPAQANAPPPNPPTANNTNLVENIDRLKLDVETIIPIHYPADSRKVTIAELNRAVGKKD